MHPGFAIALVFITAIVTIGIVLKSLIDARYRRGAARSEELGASRQLELLSSENASLKGQLGRLEERIAVLERIATDPAERTAREIDQLR
jgi:hypothetical protein